AGAPCDFKPKTKISGKIKKRKDLTLKLELTPDIAKSLSKIKKHQITIGFALEERAKLIDYAQIKKVEKNFDLIVANPLGTAGREISDYLIIGPNLVEECKERSKEELSKRIFDLILTLF
ncbi:MAG: phosphopantothenoylcysteine decarboxylase, partial [Caldimicrobium sp.]